jgi:hypothetical protein
MRRALIWATIVVLATSVAVIGADRTAGGAPVAGAAAPGTSTITGEVRVDFGTFTAGINSLPVRLVDAATNTLVAKRRTTVEARYTFTDVPAGTYLVQFLDTDHFWGTQWYDHVTGRGSATPIVVGDGVTVSGIDALLPPVSGVTGTVTADGSPRSGIDVRLYRSATGELAAKTVTAADGTYALLDLPLGDYHLRFSDPSGELALQWYGGGSSVTGAATVTVNHFVNTVADAAMTPSGTISGTVSGSGSGLAGITVRVYLATGGPRVVKLHTDAAGSFAVSLPVGTYAVQVGDTGGPWVQQWWDGASTIGHATPVAVTAGGDVALDVTLAPSSP